jgi:hypothetical protein
MQEATRQTKFPTLNSSESEQFSDRSDDLDDQDRDYAPARGIEHLTKAKNPKKAKRVKKDKVMRRAEAVRISPRRSA